MVGLDDKFTERQGAGSRKQVFAAAEPAQSAIPVDHPSSVRINRLRGGNQQMFVDRCTLLVECNADAQTIIYTGPGTDGVWFTDDDVQSSYGTNEIIYCGYRYDPESDLYYVRNRMYNPALGRWTQRDQIGYSGGINLYGYVDGRAAELQDPTGEDSCERQALKDTHDCLWAYNLAEKVIHLAFNSCIKGCATSWMNPVLCQQGCELKAGVQNSAASTALTFCNAATNVKYGLCETAKCALKLIPKPPPGPQFWPWPPTAF